MASDSSEALESGCVVVGINVVAQYTNGVDAYVLVSSACDAGIEPGTFTMWYEQAAFPNHREYLPRHICELDVTDVSAPIGCRDLLPSTWYRIVVQGPLGNAATMTVPTLGDCVIDSPSLDCSKNLVSFGCTSGSVAILDVRRPYITATGRTAYTSLATYYNTSSPYEIPLALEPGDKIVLTGAEADTSTPLSKSVVCPPKIIATPSATPTIVPAGPSGVCEEIPSGCVVHGVYVAAQYATGADAYVLVSGECDAGIEPGTFTIWYEQATSRNCTAFLPGRLCQSDVTDASAPIGCRDLLPSTWYRIVVQGPGCNSATMMVPTTGDCVIESPSLDCSKNLVSFGCASGSITILDLRRPYINARGRIAYTSLATYYNASSPYEVPLALQPGDKVVLTGADADTSAPLSTSVECPPKITSTPSFPKVTFAN